MYIYLKHPPRAGPQITPDHPAGALSAHTSSSFPVFHEEKPVPVEATPIQILLVEDTRLDAERVRDMLAGGRAFPFELTHVATLKEARQRLSNNSVDVVLLDLFLPDARGSESISALQNVALEVPIVVLTGLEDEAVAIQALQHGAQDYLLKPQVDANLLARSVRHAMERKRLELRVRMLAHYDSLTELPNRSLFQDRLERSIVQARHYKRCLALFVLGLDHFRPFNDSLGYAVGDQILRETARRLSACVKETDSVARLGSDEFALLLPEIERPEDTSAVADNLLKTLRVPLQIDDHELFLSVSIGAAVYPGDGDHHEALLKNAESAMDRAKKVGKDTFRLYSPSMNARAANRLAQTNALRRALEHGEFILHYQPQVDLGTGKLAVIEALTRWQHPHRGNLLPSQFIHLSEETGLILRLGEWVLQQACAQNRAWQKAGHPPARVSVNLSSREFNREDLLRQVSQAIARTGLPSKYLELEVSERGILEAGEGAIKILKTLKNLGVHITIDDFATGYSSLRHLKCFPIDALKIDRSFVKDLSANADSQGIVKSIISMAHNLGLHVVAEGVETMEQAAFLRDLGCHRAQGFGIGLPTEPGAIEVMLKEKRTWAFAKGSGLT